MTKAIVFDMGGVLVDLDMAACIRAFKERAGFCALLTGIPQYKADLLNELKPDYDLYILSNNNPITVRHSSRLFAAAGAPLESTFKRLFISCELKLLKPGAAIYRHVIDSIGCPPEEILFIDDSQRNVDAAAAQGMRAVFYNPAKDDLRDTVRRAL